MQLGTQLAAAALLVALMALAHGLGIVAITRLLLWRKTPEGEEAPCGRV